MLNLTFLPISFFQVQADLLHFRAALTDYNAGTGAVQINSDNVIAALDLDLRDTGGIQALFR